MGGLENTGGFTQRWAGLLCVVLIVLALMTVGCGDSVKLEFKTDYQGVLMSDGQVFYGKIRNMDKGYIYMTDVFYFQRQVDPQTKEMRNIFIKRGKEIHAPDVTYFNQKYVVSIEPVAPDSALAKMIRDAKAETEAAKNEAPKK